MNKVWSTILIILGGLITLGAYNDGGIGGGIGGIVLGLVMTLTGVNFRNKALMIEQQKQKFFPQQPPKVEINDDFLIRLANRLNKRLSVEDVVSQTSLSREEAKTRLENMALKGICEIRLDEVQNSGKIYYYFD